MSTPCRSFFRWILVAALIVETVYSQKPIERMKNCGKNDRCKGKSPILIESPEDMTPTEVRSAQCFCDDQCAEHGDCCLDISTYPNSQISTDVECVPLSHNKSVYAITGCRSDNKKLVQLCKKEVAESFYHYSFDVPVYSPVTKKYYANIYCSMCEDEKNTIEPVHVELVCTDINITLNEVINNGKYKMGNLSWEMDKGECFLILEKNETHGRPCVDSVSTCSSNNDSLADKCKAYSQIITVKKQRFKNPHCAICNGHSLSGMDCWQGFDYRSMPSLTMLLDFDWKFETCEFPKSVWDGLKRECTNICPKTKCDDSCSDDPTDLTLIVEGYLTMVCLSVSIFCLFLHIFLSFFLPNSNTLPAKILNSLSISLVIAQMLFLCGIDPLIDVPDDICQTVAVLIQFFFLSSFFWMNVMSIDLWRTFSNDSLKGQSRSHRKYAIYAWGGTGIVTGVSLICDETDLIPIKYRPLYADAENVCWFANRIGLAIFFYLPISVLLFLNSIMFGITVCWFQRQHRKSEIMKASGRKEYTRLWLYIKLFVIMGLTWACGMLAALGEKPNFRYPFIVLNGLQGTFLFIMFDIKSGVMIHLFKKMGLKKYKTPRNDDKKSERTQSSKLNSSKENK